MGMYACSARRRERGRRGGEWSHRREYIMDWDVAGPSKQELRLRGRHGLADVALPPNPETSVTVSRPANNPQLANYRHCSPSSSSIPGPNHGERCPAHTFRNKTKTGTSLPTCWTSPPLAPPPPDPMVFAAVLTVSDTASVNNLLDRSGPAAADFLKAHGYSVLHTAIVPDDKQLIRQSVNGWVYGTSHPIDLIITTGGTGFGARDITPEVLNSALAVLGFQTIDFHVRLGRVPSNRAPRPRLGPPGPVLFVEAHSFCIAFSSSSWNHKRHPNSHSSGKRQSSE